MLCPGTKAEDAIAALAIERKVQPREANPAISVAFEKSTASFAYRGKKTGQHLVVIWENSGIPGDSFETRAAQVQIKGLSIKQTWFPAEFTR